MAYIPQEKVDQVFAVSKIEDVIGDHVTLKKSGANYSGKCPFCDSKSFSVSVPKQIYKCFACGKGGKAVSFLMDFKKVQYPEALQMLIDKYNIL